MRIAMIGSGYVGLVSGACFSDFGHHVTCVDLDERKIAALREGVMPIYDVFILECFVGSTDKLRLLPRSNGVGKKQHKPCLTRCVNDIAEHNTGQDSALHASCSCPPVLCAHVFRACEWMHCDVELDFQGKQGDPST